ncbi:hypothetical protein AMK09_38085 [Streptomyces sp. CB02488]|nr:hypothetical protein AMK09_38085 [Streptomyces sp. CB02488]
MSAGEACHRASSISSGSRASLIRTALATSEIELDRRVIAREELLEALAMSAAETTAVTEAAKETATESVSAPAPLAGTTLPSWRDGLPTSVLAPDYQRILGIVADRSGQGSVKAKEIAVVLGLEPTPAKVEGVRSKARRLAERLTWSGARATP